MVGGVVGLFLLCGGWFWVLVSDVPQVGVDLTWFPGIFFRLVVVQVLGRIGGWERRRHDSGEDGVGHQE